MLFSAVNAELLLSIYYLHVEMSGPQTQELLSSHHTADEKHKLNNPTIYLWRGDV
jgi:hypothetical protein